MSSKLYSRSTGYCPIYHTAPLRESVPCLAGSQCRHLLATLVLSQPVCPLLFTCMVHRLIVGVVSEVVVRTHI